MWQSGFWARQGEGGMKRFIFKMDPKTFLYFRDSSPEPQLQVRKAAGESPQPVIAQNLMWEQRKLRTADNPWGNQGVSAENWWGITTERALVFLGWREVAHARKPASSKLMLGALSSLDCRNTLCSQTDLRDFDSKNSCLVAMMFLFHCQNFELNPWVGCSLFKPWTQHPLCSFGFSTAVHGISPSWGKG